jgi:hypothetical protein
MGWRQGPFESDTSELGERAAVALEDENQPDPARRWLAIREAGVHADLARGGLYFTMVRNMGESYAGGRDCMTLELTVNPTIREAFRWPAPLRHLVLGEPAV